MADPTLPAKPSRLWRIVLVASLALNLIIVGVVAGSVLSGRQGPPRGFELGLGPLAQALPPETRRAISDTLRRTPSLRPEGRDVRRRSLDAVLTAVRAQPFDAAALSAVLASQSDRGRMLREAAQTAMIDHIAQMTDAQRATFADALAQELTKRPPPRRSGN